MPSAQEFIEVRGAAEHNLRRVDVRLPKHALIVFTGPSGSGKSSLAFDTHLRRGPAPLRRVALELRAPVPRADGEAEVRPHPRPLADHLDRAEGGQQQPALDGRHDHRGLRLPARALGAHRAPALPPLRPRRWSGSRRRRSSTGCSRCRPGTRFLLLARLVDNRKGEYRELLREAVARGLRAASASTARSCAATSCPRSTRSASTPSTSSSTGSPCRSSGAPRARAPHRLGRDGAARRAGAAAARRSSAARSGSTPRQLWCHHCDLGFPELSPQSFSFNSPLGMCPDCNGLGTKPEMDPALVVPDPTQERARGRDRALGEGDRSARRAGPARCSTRSPRSSGSTSTSPGSELPQRHRDLLLHGSRRQEDRAHAEVRVRQDRVRARVRGRAERALPPLPPDASSEGMRRWYMRYLSETRCSTCEGRRLRPESSAVQLGDRSLPELAARRRSPRRAPSSRALALGRRPSARSPARC